MNKGIAPPPRQQISFPTVAYVRKGKPKIKVTRADGTSYETLAKLADLKDKFRIHFLPGTETARAMYHIRHDKELVDYPPPSTIANGYEVQEIRAIVPVTNIWSAWRYGNTANNSGREIGRADNDHYITLRNPLDGKYIVRNGEPYTKFTPGETIKYSRNGKDYEIPFKSNGQLRIVCADMVEQGQLVEFVLKTSSFYDCQQIQDQLSGIQSIADAVSNGNVAGIPLRIFRAEQEILWNHLDGTASRPKSWLINIQADPGWVKSIFARMGKMALASGEAGYLPAPKVISGPIDPNEDAEDHAVDEESHEWKEGDSIDGVVKGEEASAEVEMIDPYSDKAVAFASEKWNVTKVKARSQITASNKFRNPMPKSEFKTIVNG